MTKRKFLCAGCLQEIRDGEEVGEESTSVEMLASAARFNTGFVGVKEAQRTVRTEMFREALRKTGGNRHAAARVLGVDRRYVVRMLSENPEIKKSR